MFQSNLNDQINARAVKIILTAATLGLFVFSCSTGEQPGQNAVKPANAVPAPPAPTATADPAAMATELYARNCSICHRDTGKGGKLVLDGKTINPEDLTTDKMKKMTDEKLIGYVTDGIEDEGMPAFKDKLSADEIKQVVAHVRTLQTP